MRVKLKSLDNLFSQIIRMRAITNVGGCERCLTPKRDIIKADGSIFPAWKQLQCSHFHGRAQHSTRFDEDNAIGICGACHMYLTAHPLKHVDFFKERLGDRFDLLEARIRNNEKIDKELVALYLKTLIKEKDGEAETRKSLAEGKGITFNNANEAIKWLKGEAR